MKTEAQPQARKLQTQENSQADETQAETAREPLKLEQIIINQFETMQRHLAAALDSDDVESIHKLRVITRKLQASLDLLQFGEAGSGIKRLKKVLRNLRRKLSAVRNYDVFLSMIEQEAASRKASHDPFESLRKVLQTRREKHAKRVRFFLQSVNPKSLAKPLGLGSAETGNLLAGDKKVAPGAPSRFARRFDENAILQFTATRLDQRLLEFQMLAAQALPTTHAEELHQLRIAAKRLRYLLEIAAEMGYWGRPGALNWLRGLQDKIGDWHDLEAIENEIIDIAAHRKFIKHHLEEASAILSAALHLQKKKETLVRHLFPIIIHRHLESTTNRVAKSLRQASQS